jgi:hypothetical protein
MALFLCIHRGQLFSFVYVLQTKFVAHNNLTQNLRIDAAGDSNFSDAKTASV